MTGEIYVLNSIAHDAAGYLQEIKKRELERKFPPFFMHLAEKNNRERKDTSRRIRESLGKIRSFSVYCAEMAEGGILNALWYMADECKTGFEIDLRMIPIDQQTVEILEMFDVNPYYARSEGTWLVLTREPVLLENVLDGADILYEKIGSAVHAGACIIRNGEIVRYLDRPQREELEKIIQGPV